MLVFTRPPVTLLKNLNLTFMGIFYGLITAALPYLIYYYGVQKIKETSRVPVFASIELIIASVIGIVIYNELIKTINIIGIILVLSSIILDSSEGSK